MHCAADQWSVECAYNLTEEISGLSDKTEMDRKRECCDMWCCADDQADQHPVKDRLHQSAVGPQLFSASALLLSQHTGPAVGFTCFILLLACL